MTRASGREQEDVPPTSNYGGANSSSREASLSTHKGPRKRTKTGCLTCRRRRIKCGEEKPICSNCTKSKRYCEGYNPRTVPRQPMSGLGQRDDASNVRPTLLSHFASSEGYPSSLPRATPVTSSQILRPIAPSPLQMNQRTSSGVEDPSFLSSSGLFSQSLVNSSFFADRSPIPLSADSLETLQFGPHGFQGEGTDRHVCGITQHRASIPGHGRGHQRSADALSDERLHNRPSLARTSTSTSFVPFSSASNPQMPGEACPPSALLDYATAAPSAQFSSSTDDDTFLTSTQIAASGGQPLPPDHPFYSEVTAHLHDPIFETAVNEHHPKRYSTQGFVQRPSFNLSIPTMIESPPPVNASQAPYEEDEEEDEDDPWDVEIDSEEGNIQPSEQSQKDLNNMLIMNASQDARGGTRSFTTFLNHQNILASYRPSRSALPQADEKAARIFCHFVSSTGPSLTIFERSSTRQPGAKITSISGFQQPLWTYTLPSLALQHPPLMHAMLALSALHISKLQQTSPEPSIKHFTYALRRVGRLIGLPKRRNEVTTLAANLLLGFYEVMSAETSKWNIHLTGARVLVMEIDFAGKTRKIRAMRAQAKRRLAQLNLKDHSDNSRFSGIPESLLSDRDWEVDEQLISNFTGFDVRYDLQYQTNIGQATHQSLDFTAKDIELYKMQADLCWWYCKQDIFQSMLSGDRLLMHYDHWVYCPPRGQIGQLDLIYATMDHLCLIMARLADFGGKDQVRKRRIMAAHNAQPSQSTPNPLGSHGNPSTGRGPPMGYMPGPDNPAPMHSAFAMMSANLYGSGFPQQSFPTITETQDLEAETAVALAEHAAISHAFDIFAQSLPEEYGPLPPDAAPPISTPFGPALQYRTHTIACIWAFYYSGRILLHRLHPSMPPAAMVSAQVSAAQTAPYAQKIGKICAGIYYPQQYSLQSGALNPSLGGALAESHFSLFFAAIQFQDQVQRAWTISKLKEIARLSGWQTAAAVAAGCEFAWKATGEAGRGPPYRPTMDWKSKDERVGDKELKSRDKAERAQKREREKQEREKAEKEEGERMRKDREREEQYFMAAGKDGPCRGRLKSTVGKNGEGGEGDEEEAEPEAITHDRNTIGTNPYARTYWAMGLLSLEDDIAKIDSGKGS